MLPQNKTTSIARLLFQLTLAAASALAIAFPMNAVAAQSLNPVMPEGTVVTIDDSSSIVTVNETFKESIEEKDPDPKMSIGYRDTEEAIDAVVTSEDRDDNNAIFGWLLGFVALLGLVWLWLTKEKATVFVKQPSSVPEQPPLIPQPTKTTPSKPTSEPPSTQKQPERSKGEQLESLGLPSNCYGTLTVNSKLNCYVLDTNQLADLENNANTLELNPGVYVIRIESGLFNYWPQFQQKFAGEPWVLLWLYGGKFLNKKTNLEVACSWSALNGYDDTLTLEVIETIKLSALFFDTYKDDNEGQIKLSILKDE